MTTFLLIGKSFFRLRDYLQANNYNYVTLQDEKVPKVYIDDRVVFCDFSSTEKMITAAQLVAKKNNIDGVIAIYENYILPTAQIARSIGVPGLPISAAEACTDKELMREMFTRAPRKINPEFRQVNSKSDLLSFASTHQFPLILKPANLAKSLLVTKANNQKELLAQYEHTTDQIEAIYNKYAPNRAPKLLVEEFIEGSIHSVDAFIDGNGRVEVLEQVVDYETGQELGYDDNFHYSRLLPSSLSIENIAAIRQTAKLGCEALGMKNSPAHVEIILSKNGPRVVEIGARNGGYRERMHGLANGIDIIGAGLAIALGKKPNIKAIRNDYCVTLELFPKHNGIFQGIANEKTLENLASLAYYNLKVKKETFVGKSADGHKTAAVIILHHKDRAQFQKDYAYVRYNVFVITKAI